MIKLLPRTLTAIALGVVLSGTLSTSARANSLMSRVQYQHDDVEATPFWTRRPAPHRPVQPIQPVKTIQPKQMALTPPSPTPAKTVVAKKTPCCRIKLVPRASFGYNPIMGNYLQAGTYITRGSYDNYSGYSVSYSIGEYGEKINLSRSIGNRLSGSNLGIFYLTLNNSNYYSNLTKASGIELSFRLNQTILTSALAQRDNGNSFIFLGVGFGY